MLFRSQALSYEQQKAKRNKLKALEREIEKLFEQIEASDKELKRLEEEINKSENYTNIDKITKLLKQKSEIEAKKEEDELLWLEKSEELNDQA